MKKLTVILGLMCIFACQEPGRDATQEPSTAEIDTKAEIAGIERTRDSFTLALKEGRYQDIGKYTTPDVNNVRPGGPAFDAMFALAQERGRFPYDSIIMTPTETLILNDSVAYDWGTSRTYYTDKDGGVVELHNSFLAIMKKQGGIWKLHREVASSVVPPMGDLSLWVEGNTIECDAGAGKRQCLVVNYKAGQPVDGWTYFYSDIEGFEFKEGIRQLIEVDVDTLPLDQVPADASRFKYSLVRVVKEVEME